jgi:hypothetical protein
MQRLSVQAVFDERAEALSPAPAVLGWTTSPNARAQ